METTLAPLLMAGLGAAVALAVMVHNLRRARLIEDIPASKIRSAPQGGVELSGLARPDPNGPLASPLSGTPCVWYRTRIEREGDRHRWQTVQSNTSQRPFQLDDNTGHCLIDPRGADISTVRHRRWREGDHRYTESLLCEGDWLYLIGWFQSIHPPGPAAQAQQLSRQLLREWKEDQPALLARFDANGDNLIDGEEWERARSQAASQAQNIAVKEYDPTPLHMLKRPPRRGLPFIIANRDPKQLAGRYRWEARFALVAAIGLVIWGGSLLASGSVV
jgi:hypothetical protein